MKTHRVHLSDVQSRALQRAVGSGRSTWAILSLLPPSPEERAQQREAYGFSREPRVPERDAPRPWYPGDVLQLAEWWLGGEDGHQVQTVSTAINPPGIDDDAWSPPAWAPDHAIRHRLPVLSCRPLAFPFDLDVSVATETCLELDQVRVLFGAEPGAWYTRLELTDETRKIVVPARLPRPIPPSVAPAARRPNDSHLQGSLL